MKRSLVRPSVRHDRDLTLIRWPGEPYLVVTCDSLAGIGNKPHDSASFDPETVGYGLARVALLEQTTAGAHPFCLVDCLGVEMEPTGRRILAGVHRLLQEAGLHDVVAVTGSTEENMPSVQTGAGVVVLGRAQPEELRVGTARAGDLLVAVGVPRVGSSVDFACREIVSMADSAAVIACDGVHEVVPCGSAGLAGEIRQLESAAGLRAQIACPPGIDLGASAGPATCLLLACETGALGRLTDRVRCPVHVVGSLESVAEQAGL